MGEHTAQEYLEQLKGLFEKGVRGELDCYTNGEPKKDPLPLLVKNILQHLGLVNQYFGELVVHSYSHSCTNDSMIYLKSVLDTIIKQMPRMDTLIASSWNKGYEESEKINAMVEESKKAKMEEEARKIVESNLTKTPVE